MFPQNLHTYYHPILKESEIIFEPSIIFIPLVCLLQRLWVTPRAENSPPASPQKLAYISVLPDHPGGELSTYLNSLAAGATHLMVGEIATPTFDNMKQTLEKLNKHLKAKPLPGEETVR